MDVLGDNMVPLLVLHEDHLHTKKGQGQQLSAEFLL